ncbi:MAG TPA: PepSY domain-containing protein [Bryobacteraceae bacterium]|nr:PepSY domain-containing protein [Bryobacteraceae bacterium]
MPLATEKIAPSKTRSQQAADLFQVWNRKLHFYLGLYFLFFIWLFAFTGLLLNHSSWKFAEFWPTRKVSSYQRQIQHPPPGDDVVQARDVMRQLGIAGEIQWGNAPKDPGRLDFQVGRPGQSFAVKADLHQDIAKVERTEINAWGVMRVLHTFTGVRVGDTRNQRDWMLTTIWALSMDALALGLTVMVLSGIYMWYGLKGKRNLGLAALALGMVTCGWFLFGLRLLRS